MSYQKIVDKIPTEKRDKVSAKLVDLILKSKKGDKMPSDLAKNILHYQEQESLANKAGLAVLLEAAVTVEREKTTSFLEALQLSAVVKAIKGIE